MIKTLILKNLTRACQLDFLISGFPSHHFFKYHLHESILLFFFFFKSPNGSLFTGFGFKISLPPLKVLDLISLSLSNLISHYRLTQSPLRSSYFFHYFLSSSLSLFTHCSSHLLMQILSILQDPSQAPPSLVCSAPSLTHSQH